MRRGEKRKSLLTMQNAAFRLGDRVIFQNSSWVFGRDEHWAIVGDNGSGKSLLADALRGKLPLVQGELRYKFSLPQGLSAEECIAHVGFEDRKADVHGRVVQSRWNSFEVEQEQPVAEYLSFERVMEVNPFEVNPNRAGSKRKFERRRQRAIRLMEIGDLLERKMISLSNGEMQKVLIGKALCQPVRLLILDEPFTGLDRASRTHLLEVLRRLMRGALKVLFVTAREEELPEGITHAVRVNDCRIVEMGKVAVVVGKARRNRKQELIGLDRISGGGALRSSRGFQQGHHSWGKRATGRRKGRSEITIKIQNRITRRNIKRELVRMREITVKYGETVVLRDINWTVNEGESWALLGPNGSGKTTLLSLITGDHPQVYGNDVRVFGQRRGTGESMWDLRRQIGFVSPELQVHFDDSMTCLEVVESGFTDTIGLFQNPTARQRRTAGEWLRRFDLGEFEKEPLFSLSAGLSRMVLLARAVVKLPKLLILDEPCQGLDARHRQLFNGNVDALLRQRVTTAIYVTHRKEEIPAEIRRVMRLKGAK